jgi:hypothetical protein
MPEAGSFAENWKSCVGNRCLQRGLRSWNSFFRQQLGNLFFKTGCVTFGMVFITCPHIVKTQETLLVHQKHMRDSINAKFHCEFVIILLLAVEILRP